VLSFAIGRAKRTDIIDHSLINKDVAVGEKQDALFPARFPQAPDNPKRRVCFAGAGRHDEQYAVLTLGYGFNRGIYSAGLGALPLPSSK
jgi:hypothetical protein